VAFLSRVSFHAIDFSLILVDSISGSLISLHRASHSALFYSSIILGNSLLSRQTPHHHHRRLTARHTLPPCLHTTDHHNTLRAPAHLPKALYTTLTVHSLLLRVTWLANDPVGDRSDYPTTIYAQHSISYLAPTAWSFIHNCRNMSRQVVLFESVRLPPIDSRAFHCNYSMHARTISNYQSHLSRHQRRRMDGWMPGLMHHLSI
jgi:hypothetical protein